MLLKGSVHKLRLTVPKRETKTDQFLKGKFDYQDEEQLELLKCKNGCQ